MSIFAVGRLLGVKTERISPEGKPAFDTHSIGLAIPKVGGFNGENETIELKATKAIVDSLALEDIRKMPHGTMLQIPVTVGARAYQNRGYVSYYAVGAAKVIKDA